MECLRRNIGDIGMNYGVGAAHPHVLLDGGGAEVGEGVGEGKEDIGLVMFVEVGFAEFQL